MTHYSASVRVVQEDGSPRVGLYVYGRHGFSGGDGDYTDSDGWVHLNFETLMSGSLWVTFLLGKYGKDYGQYEIEPEGEISLSFTMEDTSFF